MEVTVNLSDESIDRIAKRVAVINKAENNQKRQVIIPTDQEIQYTVSEVSIMSKQSQQTIARHCRQGLLIGSKVGKSWKITQENYLKYIKNGIPEN